MKFLNNLNLPLLAFMLAITAAPLITYFNAPAYAPTPHHWVHKDTDGVTILGTGITTLEDANREFDCYHPENRLKQVAK